MALGCSSRVSGEEKKWLVGGETELRTSVAAIDRSEAVGLHSAGQDGHRPATGELSGERHRDGGGQVEGSEQRACYPAGPAIANVGPVERHRMWAAAQGQCRGCRQPEVRMDD